MISMETLKVIRVPIPSPTLKPYTTTNCFLIGNDQECILVDAGYDQKETKIELVRAIKENELATPASIILTHSHQDHAPGVRQLKEWNPVVFCHSFERQEVLASIEPFQEIKFLNDTDIIKVAGEDVVILHAPGHTSGQLNLYLPSQQVLIAGDNIVAQGTSWIGPPDGDMSDYLQTMHRLKQLTLKKIGPGHGDWVLKPYEHIEFVINRRLDRENQIKSLLKEHKDLTSEQLSEMIYKENVHPKVYYVAKRTTEAHLIKLMKEGVVRLQNSAYSLRS
jgi:glyoxylase-like metal-dependent hydrolase (beta-lactamase superfamily II)